MVGTEDPRVLFVVCLWKVTSMVWLRNDKWDHGLDQDQMLV